MAMDHRQENEAGRDALPVLRGLSLSYFTGKLEAYMRAKGLGYRFREMDMAAFRRAARATGIAQMPQLEYPDGIWLSDTTPIIRHFEEKGEGPAFSPADPVTRFLSLALEDYGDEWLWRPALYYRWVFDEDARLMSSQIARTMLRDLPLPFALRRQFILRRQRKVFLKEDGVTAKTAPAIEALYKRTLAEMDGLLQTRPFLLGARPCEADFGFFGSMFRHFSHDPTPAALMREKAPYVFAWVARLWAYCPEDAQGTVLPEGIPDGLDGLMADFRDEYLPYLAANSAAFERGARDLRYEAAGTSWALPVNPYRVHCLAALAGAYQALSGGERGQLEPLLQEGAWILSDYKGRAPDAPAAHAKPADRQWR